MRKREGGREGGTRRGDSERDFYVSSSSRCSWVGDERRVRGRCAYDDVSFLHLQQLSAE